MIEISEIPAVLRRHVVWLIVFPVLFAVLALVFVALKTPVYNASAELFVQPEGVQIIANDPGGAGNNLALRNLDLQSQTYVILSAAVLNKVANALDLDTSPQFASPGLKARLFGGASRSSGDIRAGTLDALREAINVFRRDNSLVFAIQVNHPDARLAAAIANETANAYIAQSRDSRSEALEQASALLSKQAEQLRGRVETAEAAVEVYKAQQGLISTAGGSVVDQQLDALNTQITTARVELERAKATYEQLAPLTLSDVEAGAVPQGPENSVLNSLRVQYSGIAQQEAEAATTLGANHPSLRELRSQLANTQGQIRAELQRIKQTVRGQFEQAQATVNALEQRSTNLQSQNTVQGRALIELRQLQSEADASRAVYEAFLKRSRELEELPDLDTAASRILSEAQVPTSASGPNTIVVLAAAVLFGFTLAASGIVALTVLKGPMVSERMLAGTTGAPILATVDDLHTGGSKRFSAPGWFGGRPDRKNSHIEIARTRVAYALRQAFADRRPANVLILTVGETGETSRFVRSVAEELHDMGEDVLFAHTNHEASAQADTSKSSPDAARAGALNKLAATFYGAEKSVPEGSAAKAPQQRAGGLTNFLKVEQIDPRRKYASSADLDSAAEDYLLVDAGNIDTSPMLPILLRHCDGIVLIAAVGVTRAAEFEHTIAYLEPWHDRIIGNVVLKPV